MPPHPRLAESPLSLPSSRQVLQALRRHGRISRSKLGARLGITRAGIALALAPLLEAGLIKEKVEGVNSHRGRPSFIVHPVAGSVTALGISITPFTIVLELLDLQHRTLASTSMPNRLKDSAGAKNACPDKIIQAAVKLVAKKKRALFLGAGLSFSGVIKQPAGKITSANDFASIEQMQCLLHDLEQRLNAPVTPEVCIDASLRAERWFSTDFADTRSWLFVSERLGFGVMLGGRVCTSELGCNRWLGRFCVRRSARPVPPEHRGCLCATASPSAYTDHIRGYKYGHRPQQSSQVLADDQAEVYARYAAGDKEVQRIVHRGLDDLAFVIRNLVLLFQVEFVVLGDWRPPIKDEAVARVQACLDQSVYGHPGDPQDPPRVQPSSLGARQEVFGAAMTAMDRALSVNHTG